MIQARVRAIDRAPRGFTLMEVMIALAVMMLIAATARPGVNRARAAANEMVAIGPLRIINSAQYSYTSSCGLGFYAPSPTVLATAPASSQGDGFISADLSSDPSEKSSHLLTLSPGPLPAGAAPSCNGVPAGNLVWTYYAGADPISNGGIRFFGMNQGRTIYQATATLPVTQNGAPAEGQTSSSRPPPRRRPGLLLSDAPPADTTTGGMSRGPSRPATVPTGRQLDVASRSLYKIVRFLS